MRIGIPKEIKVREARVALIPPAAAELVRHGHEVMVEKGAGEGSGYVDGDYTGVGARIAADASTLYADAELIVKVKEPQPGQARPSPYSRFRPGRLHSGGLCRPR